MVTSPNTGIEFFSEGENTYSSIDFSWPNGSDDLSSPVRKFIIGTGIVSITGERISNSGHRRSRLDNGSKTRSFGRKNCYGSMIRKA